MSLLLACCALAITGATPLAAMPPEEVTDWLRDLRAYSTDFSARLESIAHAALGTPYADGPLGEGPDGTHDRDPLMDLGRVDCVTFVEQSIALARAASYQEAFDALQRIRYKDGIIDYERRNHFFIADWIANNPFCIDLSQSLGVETLPLTRTISRRGFFDRTNAAELGRNIPDQVLTIHYVPLAQAAAAEAKLPSPGLIVFVGKTDWLFALHCGLYFRDTAGKGLLFHASSKQGSVVSQPLLAYLDENKTRYLGFTAYRINEPR
jgi:D-alanyl-D-alanine carboxypeptidase/D-alanyl-D-alanine-endopeptidase (penicillin-binding protein 4)